MIYKNKLLIGVSLTAISTMVLFPRNVLAVDLSPYVGGNTSGFDRNLNSTPTSDINFTDDDTVYVADGVDLDVAVTTTVNSQGTLAFAGNSTANEQIGEQLKSVGSILAGEGGVTATLNDDVYVTELRFGPGGGKVVLGNWVNFYGAVASTGGSTGTLELEGNATVSGTVGTARDIAIDFKGDSGETATFSDSVGASDVNVSGEGDLVFGSSLTASGDVNFTADGKVTIQGASTIAGNITTSADEQGTIAFDNNINIGGAVGAEDAELKRILVSAGTTVGVTGKVYSDDIQVLGSFSAADDVEADIDFRGANGAVSFSKDYTGNITAETDGWGEVEFGDSATVEGTIGAEGKKIKTLSLGAVGAKKVTLNGAVYTNELRFTDAAGEFEFNAALHATDLNAGASGTITFKDEASFSEMTNVVDTINVLGANKTVDFYGSNLKVADLNINPNATFKFHEDSSVLGAVNNAGILDIADNTLTFGVADLVLSGDAEIKFTVTDSGYGNIDINGNDVNLNNNVLTLTPVFSGEDAEDGASYTVISGANSILNATEDYDVTSTPLVSWTVDDSDGNKIVLTSSVKEASSVSGVNKATAKAVDNAPSDIKAEVQSLTTTKEINEASMKLAPEVNSATVVSALGATNKVSGVIGARTSQLRAGIATGDVLENVGIWGQFFGFTADQSQRNGIEGYDADTQGFAIGADKEVNDNLTLGLALSYAVTNVNNKGVLSTNGSDIDSYGLILYGNQTFDKFYVEGSLGYSYHNFENKRVVSVGAINQSLSSDYGANEYIVSLEAGKPFDFEKAVVVPVAGIRYSHLNQDGYSETGGTAALKVDSRETDSIKSKLGTKVVGDFDTDFGKFTPEFRLSWQHEFGDESVDTSSRYVSGGTSFTTNGMKLPKDAAVVGLGLTLAKKDNWSFIADYDAELKSDYTSHSGALQVKYDF